MQMLTYQLYKLFSLLIYPFIRLLLIYRVSSGKEDKLRYQEKIGSYKVKRPQGKLLWFHAASIGEFNAVLPIIREISIEYPEINILVTTVTLTAANIAKNNLPSNAIHQFAPLDCANIIKKFIAYWQPDLVIWTESELWPNMLIFAKQRAKLLLVNASLSQRSFSRWQRIKSLAKYILNNFDLILAQSHETKGFLEKLGAENVIYTGNLKFIAANFVFDEIEVQGLQLQMKDRKVIMAASTHAGEEEIFAQLQANLGKKFPKLLTIIAPRHPSRINEVKEAVSKLNLNFITRSSKQPINDDIDVLLVDTLGEFGLFYRLTEIVCIGGSWVKIGHNFIEPAKLDNLIIFGPNMNSSREIADEFLANHAALSANNEQELEKIIENYLLDSEKFTHFKDNGKKMVDKMSQIKELVLEKITPYIEGI